MSFLDHDSFDPANWRKHYRGVDSRVASASRAYEERVRAERLAKEHAAREIKLNAWLKALAKRREALRLRDEQRKLMGQMLGFTARARLRTFAKEHGVSLELILGERRDAPIVAIRHDAMATIAREFPHLSVSAIGRIFHRDHTTCLSALRKKGLR